LSWNTLKTGDAILDELGADIVCFRGARSPKRALSTRTFALPASYDSFFSFLNSQADYSGVVVCTKQPLTPSMAGEGLTGMVDPKLSRSGMPEAEDEDEGIEDMVPPEAEPGILDLDLAFLDAEGRTLVVDFGLFVLINTYSPVDSPSRTRHTYKMAYNSLLSTRVRRLIAEGREVMSVGDINVYVAAEDHCDGGLESVKGGFYDHAARRWARGLFGEGDAEEEERMLVDVIRMQQPDRKAMYTCWITKISARASNYGTRIDYILVTPALLPWVKGANIESRIQGSDRCPVWVDFKDEIQVVGKTVRLDDVMKHDKEPPRVTSQYWDECFGKQKLLSSFFGHGKGSTKQSVGVAAAGDGVDESPLSAIPEASPMDLDVAATESPTSSQASSTLTSTPPPPTASTSTSSQEVSKPPSSQPPSQLLSVSENSGNQLQNLKAGQTKLSSFFESPLTTTEPAGGGGDCQDDDISKSSSSDAWPTLLAPLQPPLCTLHREPAEGFTVKKAGPNKGKKFSICARPVGPGYHKGGAERMRAKVDHSWKCGYFKWASDAQKEAGSSQGDVACCALVLMA
ncbi:DNase I-like protein, partial [Athelia psychrophila]